MSSNVTFLDFDLDGEILVKRSGAMAVSSLFSASIFLFFFSGCFSTVLSRRLFRGKVIWTSIAGQLLHLFGPVRPVQQVLLRYRHAVSLDWSDLRAVEHPEH